MRVGDIVIGGGAPLVLISGLNVLETLDGALACAEGVHEVAERHGLPAIFKASFDKANRSSRGSYRGPGLDAGLRMLERVKETVGIPVTTDVHEPGQAKPIAEVVDLLQVPSFLSRQTDLVAACAATGRPLNMKKGQFMAPSDATLAAEKARSFGASGVMLTERGASFGYHDLIVDLRGLVLMRDSVPVCLDATHAVQHPGAGQGASSGDRRFVAPLARAAAAIGVDALFIETHPDPPRALSDAATQWPLDRLEALLAECAAVHASVPRTP